MMEYILPGLPGLLLGLILRWTRLCHPDDLRSAFALRRSHTLRSLLYAIGAGMALTALLCWLAVIDVDRITVLPLSAGTLLGGAVFGVAAALSGFTPLTAFAGAGSGQLMLALCTLAGCLAGTLLLPLMEAPLSALHTAPPYAAATLFAVTLDEPFLLGGGFLGQGCAGLLLMTVSACIPSNLRSSDVQAAVPETDATAADRESPVLPLLLLPAPKENASPEDAPALPGEEPPAEDSAQTDTGLPVADPPEEGLPEEAAPLPDTAPEETFIALLPGEEPLVVDTAQTDSEAPAADRQEENAPEETDNQL